MMTESAIVYTQASSSAGAAEELSAKVSAALSGQPPDALIVFASPRYDSSELLTKLMASVRPGVLVGASSAGEFVREIGTGLSADRGRAAQAVVASFKGLSTEAY
ncbi:MAG: FIST domain protein, partial [Polyangiaceae bacterium]